MLFLAICLAVGCGNPSSPIVSRASSSAVGTRSEAYYADAQGLAGAALLAALHRIVRTGHRDLNYDWARNAMFDWIDDPEGKDVVECVYTGRREAGVTDRLTAYHKKLNTEHTWPQSLGAEGTAKSDLHHLFPTDEIANSRRGNSPYGERKAPFALLSAEPYGAGVDEKGRQVFEPRDVHKGNVARAIFYFYVRYVVPQRGKLDLRNFRIEKETLKRWHLEDPVDERERLRNEAIWKDQGNRNPFVDHPEFVPAVGDFPS